jgi:hypothetical protein
VCLLPSGLVDPQDPAALVDRAVMGVLQEVLQLGYGQPGGQLAPVMVARILGMVTDTLDVYTVDDGIHPGSGTVEEAVSLGGQVSTAERWLAELLAASTGGRCEWCDRRPTVLCRVVSPTDPCEPPMAWLCAVCAMDPDVEVAPDGGTW